MNPTDRDVVFTLVVAALIVLIVAAGFWWLGRATLRLITRAFPTTPAETQVIHMPATGRAEVLPPPPIAQVHAALIAATEAPPAPPRWQSRRDWPSLNGPTVRLLTGRRHNAVPAQRAPSADSPVRVPAPLPPITTDEEPPLFGKTRAEFKIFDPDFQTGTTVGFTRRPGRREDRRS